MVLALNSAVSVSSEMLVSKSPNLFSKAVWLAIRLSNLSFTLVSAVLTKVAKSLSCSHGSVVEYDVDLLFFSQPLRNRCSDLFNRVQ